MEETLGKRIAANRKRLSITQDRLAEQLGVTAQAVSKWENDQSCPDISILPKLSGIFGISIDALMGVDPVSPEPVCIAEVVEDRQEHTENRSGNDWQIYYNASRKGSIGFAVLVLLVGAQLLAANILQWDVSFWQLLWPNAMLVFGVCGMFPKFSCFSLGCILFGGYFLLHYLDALPFRLGRELLLPILLLLFGVSLLVDALRKPEKNRFIVTRNGKIIKKSVSHCDQNDDAFASTVSFEEGYHTVDLPILRSGEATVSFGESTIDLTQIGEFAPGCGITATCSFGEMIIRVPESCRVEADASTAFASVSYEGHPDPEPAAVIRLEASVSFGEITVCYI